VNNHIIMIILENVPLAPLTTFKVGGPADYFAEPKTATEVVEAIQFARSRNLLLFVLGGGSNLVISDAGWSGLALKIAISGIDERNENGKTLFEVGAGEEWDRFVARAVARNCAGVECLSGIPGSVGGTPVQNVGAYGQEVWTLETARFANFVPRRAGSATAPASLIPARADVSSSCV
jgi:UDP-N-acetylmuramate dehydrogenase